MTVFRPRRRKHYVARWLDPQTGRRRERTLGTAKRREAYQRGQAIAEKVAAGLPVDDFHWLDFAALYERGHLANRSESHRQSFRTVRRYVEEFGLRSVGSITASWVVEWQLWLAREKRLARNSVASHSARLRAALRWAHRHDLLGKVPYIAVEFEEVPASRGITLEEHERILAAVSKIRPNDAAYWERFLRSLWQCNLRVGELAQLSWDSDAPIRLDTRQTYPVISMDPKSHKSRKRRLQVITREFWEICRETSVGERYGLVFGIPNGFGGTMSRKRIIRVIGQIGDRAGVITNPDKGKTATSHDIGKRSFLPKIDEKMTMPEAHKIMGHGKFDTTTKFYDTRSAQELAAKLWREE